MQHGESREAVRPLRTEADYEWALAEIEPYFIDEPEAGSSEADRFELLALVIADYEAKAWPIDPPDAPDALAEVMRQRGLRQADLAKVLGSRTRASEIMNRRRHLTLEHVWSLHKQWGIPAEILVRPYELNHRTARRMGSLK